MKKNRKKIKFCWAVFDENRNIKLDEISSEMPSIWCGEETVRRIKIIFGNEYKIKISNNRRR